MIENTLAALQELATFKTMLLMVVGASAGLIAGAIPGFTIAMAVVLTLPFTFPAVRDAEDPLRTARELCPGKY